MTTNSPADIGMPESSPEPFSLRRLAVIGIAATLANLAIYALGRAMGVSMLVTQPKPEAVGAFPIAAGTLVSLAVAGAVAWAISRRVPAFRVWAGWIGLGLALLSVAEPIAFAADFGTGAVLSVAHVVGGVAWFCALMRGRTE